MGRKRVNTETKHNLYVNVKKCREDQKSDIFSRDEIPTDTRIRIVLSTNANVGTINVANRKKQDQIDTE